MTGDLPSREFGIVLTASQQHWRCQK